MDQNLKELYSQYGECIVQLKIINGRIAQLESQISQALQQAPQKQEEKQKEKAK